MIDQMIRCKDLEKTNKIDCIYQWFEKCPPQGKLKHWVDGRSAKETAKHWLHTIPSEFINLLKPFDLKFRLCSPEFVTYFDIYGGNGRNHDLLIIAEDQHKKSTVVSVESKADEPFGDTISTRVLAAKAELKKNPRSKALNRIEDLRKDLFGNVDIDQLGLRYQLLTAVAGTLSEAKTRKAKTAIFVVQTFVSDKIDKKKHLQNQKDLDVFLEYISGGKCKTLKEGVIQGPFRFPGNKKVIPGDVDLWIGKYTITI